MELHSKLKLDMQLTVRVNQDVYSHRAGLRFSLLEKRGDDDDDDGVPRVKCQVGLK